MKKLTTSVLAVVLTSSFMVVNAQNTQGDTLRTQDIREVVVTGALGIKRKADAVTNAQQVVGSKELTQASATNAIQSLTGKVSGLVINQTNSSVDGSYRIVLRGNRSVTSNNQALVVIDNVISSASVLAQLPPEAIENVNVIKGMQGSALYGQQGANGVIIVTTKKGVKGEKIQFNLTSSVEIQQAFMLPKVQTRYGKGVQDQSYSSTDYGGTNYVPWENTSWGPAYNDPTIGGTMVPTGLPQSDGSYIYEKYAPVKDHFSKFFKKGIVFQNGLTVNAGGSDSYAFLSLNRLDNQFVVEGDNLKQNSILLKAGKKYGKLRIDARVNYISRIVDQTNAGLYDDLLQMPTTNDIRSYKNSGIDGYLTMYATNPYWTIQHERSKSVKDYLNGNLNLQYEFNKHINLTYTGSITLGSTNYNNYNDGYFSRTRYQNTGTPYLEGHTLAELNPNSEVTAYYFNHKYNNRDYYGDLMLNFDYDLTDNLNLKLNLGNNIQDYYNTASSIGGTGLLVPGWYDFRNVVNSVLPQDPNTQLDGFAMDNYLIRSRIIAGFANLDLAWKDYLFFNGTFRIEKSSVLSTNYNNENHNKAYPYYSAGLSFIPTKAFPGFGGDILNYLKIAPSFTRVGNTSGVAAYATYDRGVIPTGYPFNSLQSYLYNTQPTNRNIKPEFMNTVDLNVQMGFLKDRITLEGSVYRTITNDLITFSNVSSTSGLFRIQDNIGKTELKGYEIELGITPIKTNNVVWNLRGSISQFQSKVLELAPGIDEVVLNSPFTSPGIGTIYAIKGTDYPVIKGTTYVRDPNGNIVVGSDGTPLINSALSNLGKVTPDYVLNFNTSLRVKGFTLAASMDFRKGGHFISATKRQLAFTGGLEESANFDRSQGYVVPNSVQLIGGQYVANTTPVGTADYSGVTNFFASGNYLNVGENNVVDATAFKIREISLSYDVPKAVLNSTFVNSMSFGLYARNPFFKYADNNANYADPETANTTGNGAGIALTGQYPSIRTYGFNIKVTF